MRFTTFILFSIYSILLFSYGNSMEDDDIPPIVQMPSAIIEQLPADNSFKHLLPKQRTEDDESRESPDASDLPADFATQLKKPKKSASSSPITSKKVGRNNSLQTATDQPTTTDLDLHTTGLTIAGNSTPITPENTATTDLSTDPNSLTIMTIPSAPQDDTEAKQTTDRSLAVLLSDQLRTQEEVDELNTAGIMEIPEEPLSHTKLRSIPPSILVQSHSKPESKLDQNLFPIFLPTVKDFRIIPFLGNSPLGTGEILQKYKRPEVLENRFNPHALWKTKNGGWQNRVMFLHALRRNEHASKTSSRLPAFHTLSPSLGDFSITIKSHTELLAYIYDLDQVIQNLYQSIAHHAQLIEIYSIGKNAYEEYKQQCTKGDGVGWLTWGASFLSYNSWAAYFSAEFTREKVQDLAEARFLPKPPDQKAQSIALIKRLRFEKSLSQNRKNPMTTPSEISTSLLSMLLCNLRDNIYANVRLSKKNTHYNVLPMSVESVMTFSDVVVHEETGLKVEEDQNMIDAQPAEPMVFTDVSYAMDIDVEAIESPKTRSLPPTEPIGELRVLTSKVASVEQLSGKTFVRKPFKVNILTSKDFLKWHSQMLLNHPEILRWHQDHGTYVVQQVRTEKGWEDYEGYVGKEHVNPSKITPNLNGFSTLRGMNVAETIEIARQKAKIAQDLFYQYKRSWIELNNLIQDLIIAKLLHFFEFQSRPITPYINAHQHHLDLSDLSITDEDFNLPPVYRNFLRGKDIPFFISSADSVDLSGNHIRGHRSPVDWVGCLVPSKYLYNMPFFAETLEKLEVSHNEVSELRSFMTLTNLQELVLVGNRLSGTCTIPWTLTALRALNLSNNAIEAIEFHPGINHGEVTLQAASQSALTTLTLSYNKLTGNLRPYDSLQSLQFLDIRGNLYRQDDLQQEILRLKVQLPKLTNILTS